MSGPSVAGLEPEVRGGARCVHPALRVVSVPAGHPYVERIASTDGITLLPDPIVVGAPTGQWWPPAALDPTWIRKHAADADLLHIHFGTESFTPEQLTESIAAAHEVGWPVVQTVHDIDHPQLHDQSPYHRQLDAMLPLADAVVTLTPGAAEEIARRWGRTATVLPHPRLLESIPSTGPRRHQGLLVGMFLKDLRPNVDALSATRDLVEALMLLRTAGVTASGIVRMHRRVRDVASAQAIATLLGACADVQLVETDRLDDSELAASLGELDACVLPYAYGTHSGWLELCWDLAVPVAAPNVGYYSEQHDDRSVRTFERGSAASLAEALGAFAGASDRDVTAAGTSRRRELQVIRRQSRLSADRETSIAHADLYRALVRQVRAA